MTLNRQQKKINNNVNQLFKIHFANELNPYCKKSNQKKNQIKSFFITVFMAIRFGNLRL